MAFRDNHLDLGAEFKIFGPDRPIGRESAENLPRFVASNIRLLNQGTKVASGNLRIARWHWTWFNALLHRRGDKAWVQFDNLAWIDTRGNLRFAPLGKFDSDEDAQLFRELAVAAFKRAGDL
jgi:hypothetical protein